MAALWAEFSEPDESADRRECGRRTLRLTTMAAHSRTANEVLILDLSTTGLMLETAAPLSTGETIEVDLPLAGLIAARVVWRRETYYGCEFLARAPVSAISAALLRAAPKPRTILGARHAPIGTSDHRDSGSGNRPEPVREGLVTFVMILLLVAVSVFVVALLTLPFSANQFGA